MPRGCRLHLTSAALPPVGLAARAMRAGCGERETREEARAGMSHRVDAVAGEKTGETREAGWIVTLVRLVVGVGVVHPPDGAPNWWIDDVQMDTVEC